MYSYRRKIYLNGLKGQYYEMFDLLFSSNCSSWDPDSCVNIIFLKNIFSRSHLSFTFFAVVGYNGEQSQDSKQIYVYCIHNIKGSEKNKKFIDTISTKGQKFKIVIYAKSGTIQYKKVVNKKRRTDRKIKQQSSQNQEKMEEYVYTVIYGQIEIKRNRTTRQI